MVTRVYEDDENEEEFLDNTIIPIESNPTTKLDRRRKIEDLFEEKRLQEELADFA